MILYGLIISAYEFGTHTSYLYFFNKEENILFLFANLRNKSEYFKNDYIKSDSLNELPNTSKNIDEIKKNLDNFIVKNPPIMFFDTDNKVLYGLQNTYTDKYYFTDYTHNETKELVIDNNMTIRTNYYRRF